MSGLFSDLILRIESVYILTVQEDLDDLYRMNVDDAGEDSLENEAAVSAFLT